MLSINIYVIMNTYITFYGSSPSCQIMSHGHVTYQTTTVHYTEKKQKQKNTDEK